MRNVGALLMTGALWLVGCEPKEAADPGAVLREEGMLPPMAQYYDDPARTIHVGADDDGGLHIVAPPGAVVTQPENATFPAEAVIVMPEEQQPGARLRKSKSLGFIGDNKLGQSYRYGGSWNVPDNLLPPHQHGVPDYPPSFYYYGHYRSFGGRR